MPFLGRDTTELKLIFRYVVSGILSACVQFAALSVFVEVFLIEPTPSSGISYVLGCLANYMLLYHWAFSSNSNHVKVALKYTLVTLSTLVLNLIIFYIMTEVFHIWYLFSQAFATGLLAILNLSLNKSFTFPSNERVGIHTENVLNSRHNIEGER